MSSVVPNLTIDDETVLPRLVDYVARAARQCPDSIAIVCRGQRLSYQQLATQIDRWSLALLASGVRKGDRVAMLCTTRADFWIAFLSTTRIGAIWVGLNPRYSDRECDYVLNDAKPRILLTLSGHNGEHYGERVTALTDRHSDMIAVSLGETLPGATDLDDFLLAGQHGTTAQLEAASNATETFDPALIVYTSGSTGNPKGALLSHYGLCYGAVMQARHFNLDRPSLVVSFPINHVASVADTCATTLVRGGKIVFQEQFDAAASVRATVEERCTMMAGVPTMFQLQMTSPDFDKADLSALELILWGGAAMPEAIIRRLQKLNKRLLTAYGMTETACHVTYTDADADIDQLANTVGRADKHCRIRFSTPDNQTASRENPGELQVHGDFLMLRYWQREAATRDVFTKDGWLRTGDLAYPQDDGNIRLVGRLSDMFKSGGYNIYPREVEQVLESHPAVALAAVIAIPDPLYQEVGAAYLKLDGDQMVTADTIRDWCRTKLANYKIPKRIDIVDDLPLLPVGKIDKQALRARAP